MLKITEVEDIWTEDFCGGTHVYFLVRSTETGKHDEALWSCSRGNHQDETGEWIIAPCGESLDPSHMTQVDEYGDVL